MKEVYSESISIICSPYSVTPNTVKVYYILDDDEYKVYRPFIGCENLGGTNPCDKCIKYIQKQMLDNTLITTSVIYLPEHL